ncbi:MAG: hypothetical protein JWN67_2534 [Actinomycetia bacterium]|nr:hypothetical protein [Actinomycetes bacterium]
METEAVIAFLEERGAATLEHPGGTLLAHLRRTADTLERWGAPDALVLAGLAHATYGTDGFPSSLATLDERPLVQALLGDEAEALVYEYAASDRAVTWPAIEEPAVAYRDRFTDETRTIEGDRLRAYWTLSVANELDLAHLYDPASIVAHLRRATHLLPPAALEDLA